MNPPAAAIMHGPIDIPREHPSFAGHFPKFPVLPGAVLLDEVLQSIHLARGIDLEEWRVASVKFLGAVRPGDSLHLEHVLVGAVIRFTIRTGSRIVASGTLSGETRPDSNA